MEAMFRRAYTAARTQKSPANESGVQYMAYIGDTKDGRRCYESGFDSSVSMDVRIEEFKNKISTIFNLGAVELKTDTKKIKIRADKFTAQKTVYGDLVVRDSEKEARINALFDLADILAASTYDPTATAKETNYENPNVKPKNKAHKGVKYWYKFRNEIVFDGVPFTVTFNIRDKGTEQYQYLIEFKENKALGISNTVAKNNLLRTYQTPYIPIISDPPSKSNTQYSLSDDATEDMSANGEDASTAKWPFTPKPMSEETKKAWDDAGKAMHTAFTEEMYRASHRGDDMLGLRLG